MSSPKCKVVHPGPTPATVPHVFSGALRPALIASLRTLRPVLIFVDSKLPHRPSTCVVRRRQMKARSGGCLTCQISLAMLHMCWWWFAFSRTYHDNRNKLQSISAFIWSSFYFLYYFNIIPFHSTSFSLQIFCKVLKKRNCW